MKAASRFAILVFGALMSHVLTAAELGATLQWYQKVPMTFPVSGIITEVSVDVGGRVKQGDVMMQLDSRHQQAELVAKESGAKAALNNRDEAQREMERTQEMYDQTLLTDYDLQQAIIVRDAAEADYQHTRARLVRAQLALEYTTLRAPFDALVVDRQAGVGQFVNSKLQANALLQVAEAGRMVARANVGQAQRVGLPVGKSVRIVIGQTSLNGVVIRAGVEALAASPGKYEMDIMFETAGHLFYVGQAAKVIY